MNDNMSTNIFYGSNHDDLHFDSSEYGDSLYGALTLWLLTLRLWWRDW